MNEIVDRLLKRRVRPDVRDNVGYNALMIASHEGRADIVKALLNAGADRTLRNKKRDTAVDVATASGHAEIVQLLKQ
jgi:serine/threonine-protein phosphatase 6 regulatory ankyrin repeat subunit B